MTPNPDFSLESKKTIARAVRKILGQPSRESNVTRPAAPRSAPRGLFPVRVTKDGGVQGTKVTKATWTYTVNDLDGNELGTTVGLAHMRPNGTMAFPDDDSYGVAFYDGSTLILWDANEVPGRGGCT